MKQNGDNRREGSYGGFQYRWNYDEYQKSLQRKRRKNAAHGMRAFCLTTVFVVLLCFASLMVVMTAAFLRGAVSGLSDKVPAPTNPHEGLTVPMEGDDVQTAENPMFLETQALPSEPSEIETQPVSLPQKEAETTAIGAVVDVFADQKTESAAVTDALLADNSYTAPDILSAMTVNEIAAACTASTVTVYCKDETLEAVGSGFFLSEDGYIVTNYHVIRKFSAYTVLLSDGTSYDASFVGGDKLQDLALLKIELADAPAVRCGKSSALAIGDEVIAIGTPGAVQFAGTVTHGNVSGLDRDVPIMDENETVIGHMAMIQISAVINPGNSGGPLFNAYGEVVGINTMKMSGDGYEGMGFSIPIDTVAENLQTWMTDHRAANMPPETEEDTSVVIMQNKVPTLGSAPSSDASDTDTSPPPRETVALGIRCEAVTEEEAALYRVPRGVLVRFIEPGSFAERCGLESGDILISAQCGEEMTAFDVFDSYLAWEEELYRGDEFLCTVFREGKTIAVTLSLIDEEPVGEAA